MVVTVNTGLIWLVFMTGFFFGCLAVGIIVEKIGG